MSKQTRPIIECRICHKLKQHQGMGLCSKCYQIKNNKWIRMSKKEKEKYRNSNNDMKEHYKNLEKIKEEIREKLNMGEINDLKKYYDNKEITKYYNKKYYKDAIKIYEKGKTKRYYDQYNKTHKISNIADSKSEESKILRFCIRQGIERNEFTGFYNKVRDYVLLEYQCIQLNQRFIGSEGHHILTGVIIYIPKYIHRSVYHNMKNGKGMKEINKLALNYLINNK